MPNPPEHSRFSRRELLKRVGLAGTAAVSVTGLAATDADAATQATKTKPATPAPHAPHAPAAPAAAARREAFETLTAAESDTLEAIVARLIPHDDQGPGAGEARAAHYIDRALGGPLAASHAAYQAGLAALNAHAQSTRNAQFAALTPADQDAMLHELERDAVPGFTPSASAFFNLVRAHTIEGTFSDPYYGGNAGFAGWDLIGYPGVRVGVTPEEQQFGAHVQPNHLSAYDFTMFAKPGPAKPSPSKPGSAKHGD